MGLEDPGTIDALSVDKAGRTVVNIIDSWDWSEPGSHLRALTMKLDAAASFVHSHQYIDEYPLHRGREVVIRLTHRHPVPDICHETLRLFREKCRPPIVAVETHSYER